MCVKYLKYLPIAIGIAFCFFANYYRPYMACGRMMCDENYYSYAHYQKDFAEASDYDEQPVLDMPLLCFEYALIVFVAGMSVSLVLCRI